MAPLYSTFSLTNAQAKSHLAVFGTADGCTQLRNELQMPASACSCLPPWCARVRSCRAGRAIKGSARMVADIVRSGASILFLGRCVRVQIA